ncbi:MAG: hypothetical protein B7Y39_19775 [Bdellovibrio sp. 28-41-41]|nr:MAG: hypothetical protein B7Y39_19775 [Bdellovibrio sp. 28-41-41]
MDTLQKNKLFMMVILFSLFGCTTATYRAYKENSLGTDIEVSPDRVITECEFITDYEGDRKNPYGFMIHILDLQKTVLTVSNAVVLEKEDCLERQTAVDKIIKNAHQILTIRGRGDAEAPIVKEKFKSTFKKHGTYFGNGRSLNFISVWNDKRDCYNVLGDEDSACRSGHSEDLLN